MMAECPNRSWIKIYTQLWQLALKDTINKNSFGNSSGSQGGGGSRTNSNLNSGNGNSNNQKRHKSWRDNCCWLFNRNGKCDHINCGFDNRCPYCGGWNLSANICRKKQGSSDKSSKTGAEMENKSFMILISAVITLSAKSLVVEKFN